jgi:nicotinamide riboside transporter PnuC
MNVTNWISGNYIELFGAITGIIYVFLEIRQSIWLWPVGIITSGVYIWVFFNGKIYADMSLQVYYLVISVLGWYWWLKGTEQGAHTGQRREEGEVVKVRMGDRNEAKIQQQRNEETKTLQVTRLKLRTPDELNF